MRRKRDYEEDDDDLIIEDAEINFVDNEDDEATDDDFGL